MTQSRVTHTLLILHNCAAEAERHYVFNSGADTMLKYLVPYSKSSNPSVSFDAKIVLLHIAPYLSKSDFHYLLLSSDQTKLVVSSLRNAIKNSETMLSLYGGTCSMVEVIVWLEHAALLEENVDLMINHGILELFPSLIRIQDQDTAIKGAKLLWTIACLDKVKKILCQSSDVTTFLKTSPNLKISKYVLHCIQLSDAGEVFNKYYESAFKR